MKNKTIVLLASSLLFTALAQPIFAAKPNKLQPKNHVKIDAGESVNQTQNQSIYLSDDDNEGH